MASSNTAVSSSKSEFYNPWAEHSKEDIELVNRLEDAERQRRIADVLGEQQRRNAANQVSEIVSTSLRPNWFNEGTAYVFNILKMARKAGNNLLRSSQVRQMSANLQIYAQKGIAGAQDFAHKVEVVGHRAQEKSEDVKEDVKIKLQDTKTKLQGLSESAGNIAQQGIEKVQEVAKKLKKVSLKWFGKAQQAFTNISENTNLAFAVLEEEGERQWRLNSPLEVYAIMNALAVSRLMKETAPALYRPAFEPTRKYSTRLLEEYERTRRSLSDVSDHTAVNNAKAVANLIQQKFAPVQVAPMRKVEPIEAPALKTPAPATM